LEPNVEQEVRVDADLDTLATALYARTDDLLKSHPERVPSRPRVGIAPRISDAELVTMAVMQALLGFASEARWLRHASAHLRHLFPYLPQQPGYNKRLRRLAPTLNWLTGMLARDTSVWTDDVWVVDSTPVECARSRDAVKRSDLAGWAEYGYCASHSRFFWGLRLHLVATLHGLPIGFALTGAKADERQVLLDLLHDDPTLAASRPGQILIADKNYYGRDFEADLASQGIRLLRRPRQGEPERAGGRFFKPLRQTVESIYDTLKGQLNLEQHGGHTKTGAWSAFCNGCWRCPPRCGTTTAPANQFDARYSPTTTDTAWNRSSRCAGGSLFTGGPSGTGPSREHDAAGARRRRALVRVRAGADRWRLRRRRRGGGRVRLIPRGARAEGRLLPGRRVGAPDQRQPPRPPRSGCQARAADPRRYHVWARTQGPRGRRGPARKCRTGTGRPPLSLFRWSLRYRDGAAEAGGAAGASGRRSPTGTIPRHCPTGPKVRGMPPVVYRAASQQDAQQIAPMHLSCWHEAYAGLVPQRCLDDLDAQDRVAQWRGRLERQEDATTIAVHDGRVVGLTTVGPAQTALPLAPEELRSLYVVRDMWGRGLGKQLLQHALADRPASLWVFEGNERARRFYARTGWSPTSERHVDEWTAIPELRLVRDWVRESPDA
jgi:GNAT superfamily N-acetyltransferase